MFLHEGGADFFGPGLAVGISDPAGLKTVSSLTSGLVRLLLEYGNGVLYCWSPRRAGVGQDLQVLEFFLVLLFVIALCRLFEDIQQQLRQRRAKRTLEPQVAQGVASAEPDQGQSAATQKGKKLRRALKIRKDFPPKSSQVTEALDGPVIGRLAGRQQQDLVKAAEDQL